MEVKAGLRFAGPVINEFTYHSAKRRGVSWRPSRPGFSPMASSNSHATCSSVALLTYSSNHPCLPHVFITSPCKRIRMGPLPPVSWYSILPAESSIVCSSSVIPFYLLPLCACPRKAWGTATPTASEQDQHAHYRRKQPNYMPGSSPGECSHIPSLLSCGSRLCTHSTSEK